MIRVDTPEQYERALKRVEELTPLVNVRTPINDRNYIELELLTHLVYNYEERHFISKESAISSSGYFAKK